MGGKESELSTVINVKSGRTGLVIGREEKGGERYVRVKFSDYESLIPEELFRSSYQEFDASVSEGKSFTDLREHIRIARLHDIRPPHPDVYERVKEVIREANESDLLYRCDLRAPLGAGGIFGRGFTPNTGGRYGNVISTATSLEFALSYPDPGEIPKGWDSIKFIYVIDPFHKDIEKGEFGTMSEIADADNYVEPTAEEILYNNIPASAIKYALEYNDKIHRFTRIRRNPAYLITDSSSSVDR